MKLIYERKLCIVIKDGKVDSQNIVEITPISFCENKENPQLCVVSSSNTIKILYGKLIEGYP